MNQVKALADDPLALQSAAPLPWQDFLEREKGRRLGFLPPQIAAPAPAGKPEEVSKATAWEPLILGQPPSLGTHPSEGNPEGLTVAHVQPFNNVPKEKHVTIQISPSEAMQAGEGQVLSLGSPDKPSAHTARPAHGPGAGGEPEPGTMVLWTGAHHHAQSSKHTLKVVARSLLQIWCRCWG